MWARPGLCFSSIYPIRWFPDRRGMATGMAIMGFGGGAMIGAPLKKYLLDYFAKAPEYLGVESAGFYGNRRRT